MHTCQSNSNQGVAMLRHFINTASKTKQAALAGLILSFSLATSANALTAAFDPAVTFAPPAGDPASLTDAGTVGWSFSLSTSRELIRLGLYNSDFSASTTVAIWNNSSSTPIAQSTFTTALTGVDMSDLGTSNFLWMTVTPLTLAAGEYTIGAFSSTDHFGAYGVTPTTTAGLSIVSPSLLSFAGSLEKPTTDFSVVYPNGFYGPNLAFTPVPLPAGFWLLGSGLLGLMGFKRVKTAA